MKRLLINQGKKYFIERKKREKKKIVDEHQCKEIIKAFENTIIVIVTASSF